VVGSILQSHQREHTYCFLLFFCFLMLIIFYFILLLFLFYTCAALGDCLVCLVVKLEVKGSIVNRVQKTSFSVVATSKNSTPKTQKIGRVQYSSPAFFMSLGSSVTVVTGYRLHDWGLIPSRSRDFFLCCHIQTCSGGHTVFFPIGTGGSSS
jgi:hypothetical protein